MSIRLLEQSVEQLSEETATKAGNMFEIDMASVLAGVQQIIMRRIFDELPCDQTNSVRVRVRDCSVVVVKTICSDSVSFFSFPFHSSLAGTCLCNVIGF